MKLEFFKNYKYKIKKLSQLKILFKKKNKKLKIVMCHGVFDLVHPGHIRHLAYAKSKGDILLVTITSDIHIKKGIYRPHVPQNLRALNLAAFEMVDYVLIDSNPTPLNNIEVLKPNYFAKGFEYSSTGLPKATYEELKVVKKNGGEMLFTPGDIVYSSSNFLNENLPKLNIDKLLLLLYQNSLSFKDLRGSIKKISNTSVHVIGDTIVDSYTRTSLIGGQTKTPTFSVLFNEKNDYVGGAGIVAKHLEAAGAKVTFTTVLGQDDLMRYVKSSFKNTTIKLNAIIDKKRPTTNKNVITTDIYKLLKIDKVDNSPIDETIIKKIISLIKLTKTKSIIFSDFRHGIFNNQSIQRFVNSIPANMFKVADSQVATRWGNISDFKNFDLITPNEKEARFSLADQDSNIGTLASKLRVESNYRNLILKLGSKGVLCVGEKNDNEAFNIDSFTDNVVDAVGAGDALLAYSTLILFKTKSLVLAGIIGSIAASCECEVDGNAPIKAEKILDKINQLEKKIKI